MWSASPVLGVIPPFTLVLLRYLLALTVLLPLAIRICRRDGIRIARADRSNFLFIGIAGYGIATGAQFARHTPVQRLGCLAHQFHESGHHCNIRRVAAGGTPDPGRGLLHSPL